MNYLAHFALAADRSDWITGALLGDFVKGPVACHDYRAPIAQGIVLHRRIDGFSSSHRAYQAGCSVLAPRWRRYGGIVLDVVFDHFLARRWSHYHAVDLDAFADRVYRILATEHPALPPPAQRFARRLIDHDLLRRYASGQLIEGVLESIGRRLRRPVALHEALLELSPAALAELEGLFEHFYPALQQFAATEKHRFDGNVDSRRRRQS